MTDLPANPLLDTSSIMRSYILLALGIPMTFSQLGMLSALGLVLFLFGIVRAYTARKNPDPVIHVHGRWMVRTIWISTFLFFIALALSTSVVSSNADPTSTENIAKALTSGTASPEDIKALVLEFQAENKALLFWSALICFLPPGIYTVLRLIKGYRLADAGKPVPNVTNWLI